MPYLLVIERVLCIQHGKHLLEQYVKEVIHRFGQVHLAMGIVALQLSKQISEDVRILLVDRAVRALEHGVEPVLGLNQQLFEEF